MLDFFNILIFISISFDLIEIPFNLPAFLLLHHHTIESQNRSFL
jgi:hypothetical protein